MGTRNGSFPPTRQSQHHFALAAVLGGHKVGGSRLGPRASAGKVALKNRCGSP